MTIAKTFSDHDLDWMGEPNPFMIFLSHNEREAVKTGRKKLTVYKNVPILEEVDDSKQITKEC